MKITYLGNFNDVKFEGLITVLNSLKKEFAKYDLTINSAERKTDLINIHSSGFYESIKYQNLKAKKVYSLHSNIKNNFFKLLLDYIEDYSYFYDKKNDQYKKIDRLTKNLMNILSNLTPIFVKRHFLKKMNWIILPNYYTSQRLKLKNSSVIYPGIDIKKFKPIKKTINKKIKISYFGHASSAKGLNEIVKSFRSLEKICSTEVFISNLNPKIEKFIEKKCRKTKINGFSKNIVKDYNNSDVIILPYRHSGGAIATPLVLIEAMACGKTIITTNLPHLREICGDSVIYVKPYSTRDIIKKCIFLSNHPELIKKMGKSARKRIVLHYNNTKMFKKYDILYKRILKV